ncbi:MAG: hypothetical protein MRJ65_15655 [Candidatus Brocadiaceae bacterium]|nr:hypothetical protein [Candidatus Brocadiaceae bacterium]
MPNVWSESVSIIDAYTDKILKTVNLNSENGVPDPVR